VTNEQAFVEGTESKRWTMVTPKRRQELSLAGMALVVVSMFGGVALIIRWAQRRRR
jgi:hypothetical protein